MNLREYRKTILRQQLRMVSVNSGIAASTISKIENGFAPPSWNWDKLAKAYGVDIETFRNLLKDSSGSVDHVTAEDKPSGVCVKMKLWVQRPVQEEISLDSVKRAYYVRNDEKLVNCAVCQTIIGLDAVVVGKCGEDVYLMHESCCSQPVNRTEEFGSSGKDESIGTGIGDGAETSTASVTDVASVSSATG